MLCPLVMVLDRERKHEDTGSAEDPRYPIHKICLIQWHKNFHLDKRGENERCEEKRTGDEITIMLHANSMSYSCLPTRRSWGHCRQSLSSGGVSSGG